MSWRSWRLLGAPQIRRKNVPPPKSTLRRENEIRHLARSLGKDELIHFFLAFRKSDGVAGVCSTTDSRGFLGEKPPQCRGIDTRQAHTADKGLVYNTTHHQSTVDRFQRRYASFLCLIIRHTQLTLLGFPGTELASSSSSPGGGSDVGKVKESGVYKDTRSAHICSHRPFSGFKTGGVPTQPYSARLTTPVSLKSMKLNGSKKGSVALGIYVKQANQAGYVKTEEGRSNV